MAKAAVATKIPQDIEYKVIGNAFGLLIATGGLLAGNMVSERSLEYWRDDVVPLALLIIMGFRLFRSFTTTMAVYQDAPPPVRRNVPQPRETVQPDQAAVAQITETPAYSTEQVVAEVFKRIDAKRSDQAKKNQPHETNQPHE